MVGRWSVLSIEMKGRFEKKRSITFKSLVGWRHRNEDIEEEEILSPQPKESQLQSLKSNLSVNNFVFDRSSIKSSGAATMNNPYISEQQGLEPIEGEANRSTTQISVSMLKREVSLDSVKDKDSSSPDITEGLGYEDEVSYKSEVGYEPEICSSNEEFYSKNQDEIQAHRKRSMSKLKILLESQNAKIDEELASSRASYQNLNLIGSTPIKHTLSRFSNLTSKYPETQFSGSFMSNVSLPNESVYQESVLAPSQCQFDRDFDLFIGSEANVEVSRLESKLNEINRFVTAMVTHERAKLLTSVVIIQSAFRAYLARNQYKTLLSFRWYNTALFPPNISSLIKYGVGAKHYQVGKTREQNFLFLLQHLVRGFLIKKQYRLVLKYNKSATKIQAICRGFQIRNCSSQHFPPLRGIIKNLASHQLTIQKLATQVENLTFKMEAKPLHPTIIYKDEGISVSPTVELSAQLLPITILKESNSTYPISFPLLSPNLNQDTSLMGPIPGTFQSQNASLIITNIIKSNDISPEFHSPLLQPVSKDDIIDLSLQLELLKSRLDSILSII